MKSKFANISSREFDHFEPGRQIKFNEYFHAVGQSNSVARYAFKCMDDSRLFLPYFIINLIYLHIFSITLFTQIDDELCAPDNLSYLAKDNDASRHSNIDVWLEEIKS